MNSEAPTEVLRSRRRPRDPHRDRHPLGRRRHHIVAVRRVPRSERHRRLRRIAPRSHRLSAQHGACRRISDTTGRHAMTVNEDLEVIRRFVIEDHPGIRARAATRAAVDAFDRVDTAMSVSTGDRPAAWDFQRPVDAARIAALEAACETIQDALRGSSSFGMADRISAALADVGFDPR